MLHDYMKCLINNLILYLSINYQNTFDEDYLHVYIKFEKKNKKLQILSSQ